MTELIQSIEDLSGFIVLVVATYFLIFIFPKLM